MSELDDALFHRFGRNILLAGFCKKASKIRTFGRIDRLIKTYIDDRTKEDYREINPSDEIDPEAYIESIFEDGAILREGSELGHILASERVTLNGFLVEQSGLSSLESPEDARLLSEFWKENTHSLSTKGTHFIFSLDPRISSKFTDLGQSSHGHLLNCVDQTMSRFKETFYPEDSIGYVSGFHSDRHHPHLHVLLFPRLESGKSFNVSSWSLKGDSRLDYQGFLKREFNRQCWDAYLNFAVLPEQRAQIYREMATTLPSIKGNSAAILAALEDAQGIKDRAGRPLRDFFPVAMDAFLRDDGRDYTAMDVLSRRQFISLEKLKEGVENEDQKDVSLEKILPLFGAARECFNPMVQLLSDRRSRIRKAVESLKNRGDFDASSLLTPRKDFESGWKGACLASKIGSHLSLFAATVSSELLFEQRGKIPPHLRIDEEKDQIRFPLSSQGIRDNFERKLQENIKEEGSGRSTITVESLKNQRLFEVSERVGQRKRAKFLVKRSERIIRTLEGGIKREIPQVDAEIKISEIYSKERNLLQIKERTRSSIEVGSQLPSTAELTAKLEATVPVRPDDSVVKEFELI